MKAINKIKNFLLSMGLKKKVIFGVTLVILMLSLVTTLFINMNQTDILTNALKQKGIIITRNLSVNAATPILMQHIVDLHRIIRDATTVEEDISYVYILNSKGVVLAHTFERGFPVGLRKLPPPAPDQAYSIQLLETEEGYIHDIAVPIMDSLGVVHVGMSENRIRQAIARTTRTLLFVTLIGMTLGMLMASFIVARVLKPLKMLTRGAEEIGSGNLEYRIHINTNDEIGILADKFNFMTGRIQDSLQKIEAAKEYTDNIVATVPSILIVLSNNLNILSTNMPFEEPDNNSSLITPRQFITPLEAEIRKCIKTGKSQKKEIILRPGAVDSLVFSTVLSQITIIEEEKPGVLLTITDITDLKRAEEKLIKSEMEWSKTFNSISDFVSVHDKDFKFVKVNKALADFLGMKPEELIGKYCYKVMHNRTDPWPDCPHAKTLKLKIAVTENVNDPNIGCPLLVSTSPVLDENGELVETVHIAKNITELKLVEEKLRKTQESLARAQQIAHLGNWDWDIVANELWWSDEIYSIFGLAIRGATYKTFLNSVHPDERNFVLRSVNKALYENKPYNIDHRIILSDRTERIVHEQAEVFFDDGGKPVRMVGTVQDITEQKRGEALLIEQSAELQTINSELKVLNRISTAINQTISLDKLLNIVLETITGLELLRVDAKGGIFIIDGNRMNLVSQLGNSEAFVDLHKNMNIGDCLCGLAAKTGEIIISGNSDNDSRHTFRYPGMNPHGHIIIPLKAMNKTIGVLYLYLPADIDIIKHKITLFRSIGNQIGIAIENSRLYEETKALSLHEPLTGLANRRFMHIVFERSFARAKRLKRPLSIIMLDIDHFKKYNDTYGHIEGDMRLIEVANILVKETREIDLAVRYGGEEFLILLPETELSKASEVAERIRKSVMTETEVTISIGVSSFRDEMHKMDDLTNKADSALYQAKNKGRNRVEVI